MRKEFEMTDQQLTTLLDACKPTPCIMIGDYVPPTPQENANRAWGQLGKELGFDYMSVQPVPGKGTKFFTADVKE